MRETNTKIFIPTRDQQEEGDELIRVTSLSDADAECARQCMQDVIAARYAIVNIVVIIIQHFFKHIYYTVCRILHMITKVYNDRYFFTPIINITSNNSDENRFREQDARRLQRRREEEFLHNERVRGRAYALEHDNNTQPLPVQSVYARQLVTEPPHSGYEPSGLTHEAYQYALQVPHYVPLSELEELLQAVALSKQRTATLSLTRTSVSLTALSGTHNEIIQAINSIANEEYKRIAAAAAAEVRAAAVRNERARLVNSIPANPRAPAAPAQTRPESSTCIIC